MAIDRIAKPGKGSGAEAEELVPRTHEQRCADALGQIGEWFLAYADAPGRHGHGAAASKVVITVDAAALDAGDGHGTLLRTGEQLSIPTVEQFLCTSQVARASLDGDEPTMTDAKLFFTGKTRELLEIRDRGCAFPGCTIPAGWCDAHHIRPYSQGGPTTLDNGVLLCRFHHGIVHHSPWDIRYDQRRRLPEFLPPPTWDPERTPLHNHRARPTALP